jgi:hypothetical protein
VNIIEKRKQKRTIMEREKRGRRVGEEKWENLKLDGFGPSLKLGSNFFFFLQISNTKKPKTEFETRSKYLKTKFQTRFRLGYQIYPKILPNHYFYYCNYKRILLFFFFFFPFFVCVSPCNFLFSTLVVCSKKWLQWPDKSIMLSRKMSPKWFLKVIVHEKGVAPLQKTTEMKNSSIRHRFIQIGLFWKWRGYGTWLFCARNYKKTFLFFYAWQDLICILLNLQITYFLFWKRNITYIL